MATLFAYTQIENGETWYDGDYTSPIDAPIADFFLDQEDTKERKLFDRRITVDGLKLRHVAILYRELWNEQKEIHHSFLISEEELDAANVDAIDNLISALSYIVADTKFPKK